MKVYLIGSLRQPVVQDIAEELRDEFDFEVFDDWAAAGPEADDMWQNYETRRGRRFVEALQGHAAKHVFEYDYKHLSEADIVILVLPAGRSAHLELGWAIGRGKKAYVLLPIGYGDRWDVMYRFADGVFEEMFDLKEAIREATRKK